MYNHILYFAYWFVNAMVLLAAFYLVPDHVITLGSWRFSSIESSLYAGFWLTFLIWVFWDFAIAQKFDFSRKNVVVIFFLIVNFFSLWVISLFSHFTGFAITDYVWMMTLSVILTILQRITWSLVVTRR